jgi:hypothetical protein
MVARVRKIRFADPAGRRVVERIHPSRVEIHGAQPRVLVSLRTGDVVHCVESRVVKHATATAAIREGSHGLPSLSDWL